MSEQQQPRVNSTIIGGFNLNYVHLYGSNSEEPIDITELVANVDVYEAIDAPFLTIDISLIDNLGLIDKLPILGEEFVNLDIRDQGNADGLKSFMCYVYKLSDRVQISDRGFVYTLKCISLECLADLNLKLSKSFSGTPSKLIKDMLDHSTGTLPTKKTLFLEDTKNTVEYISNYWSPLQNIRYITERAVSRERNAPSYVFFENIQGFVFSSLDTMVAQPASYTYFFTINPKIRKEQAQLSLNGDTSFDSRQRIVENMWVDETFDYFYKLKTGAYGVRTLQVDPFKKEYSYDTYDFLESYATFNRLNKKPFNSDKSVRKLNSVFRTKVTPTSAFPTMLSDDSNVWFKKRLTEMGAIDSQSVEIDVPGKFGIYCGQVIELMVFAGHIPSNDSDNMAFRDLADKVFSGRYLVTAIHHTFTRERHSMSIKLNKDSMIGKTDDVQGTQD